MLLAVQAEKHKDQVNFFQDMAIFTNLNELFCLFKIHGTFTELPEPVIMSCCI